VAIAIPAREISSLVVTVFISPSLRPRLCDALLPRDRDGLYKRRATVREFAKCRIQAVFMTTAIRACRPELTTQKSGSIVLRE
jgi:hypothetical protein